MGSKKTATFLLDNDDFDVIISITRKEIEMDVYCANCGEPCDIYHLNNDMEPKFRQMFKAAKGCDCCEGKKQEGEKPLRASLSSVAMDLLGDDLDGAASVLDDYEYMIGEKFWE